MKTTIYTESNEFPADMLPRGEHAATWQGCSLRLHDPVVIVYTDVAFPGTAACTAVVTDETISIVVELAP